MKRLLLMVVVFAAAVTAKAADDDGLCSVLTQGETQVVESTNAARVEQGLPPLVIDCRLMGTARRHARAMASAMSMYHSSGVAENVAYGQPTAVLAVRSWLRSPGHRANILGRSYSRIGVAGFIGPDGRAYWVQQFAP
jgi:uncharacterized protein YkwD